VISSNSIEGTRDDIPSHAALLLAAGALASMSLPDKALAAASAAADQSGDIGSPRRDAPVL
jgi:hypothetical protein